MTHTTVRRPEPGDDPGPPAPSEAGTAAGSWRQALESLYAAGERAGTDAADWWAQDTVGGRATRDVAATARMILTGIDDGDPAVLDALPACDLSGRWPDTPTGVQLYADAAPADAPDWSHLDERVRADAVDAFRDGYHRGAVDRVAEHCRLALPDPDDGDAAG